jgi:hypothetical protein
LGAVLDYYLRQPMNTAETEEKAEPNLSSSGLTTCLSRPAPLASDGHAQVMTAFPVLNKGAGAAPAMASWGSRFWSHRRFCSRDGTSAIAAPRKCDQKPVTEQSR